MNREIKFRAWDGKEMHIPCIYDKYANVNFWSFKQIAKNWLEMAGITIMQYTGLKDDNGVEIYDGDILCTYFDGQPCYNEVSFENGSFGLIGEITKKHQSFCIETLPESFVVGNIYQNPELLNQ